MIKLNTTKKSNGTNTKEYILLHHTGSTASAIDNANYLAKSSAQVSVHYVVGQEGEVIKIGEDDYIMWHAGTSEWDGKTDLNRYSIGIEINSDGDNFTDIQRKAVKELVLDLMEKYNITKEDVIRHKDITSRKWDVGDNFWSTEFDTYLDYQNSLTNENMLIDETILLLKDLWGKQSDKDKVKIGELASKLRTLQGALGETISD